MLKRQFSGMSLALQSRIRGELSFFISHWGKTRFMVAMSKKLQYHGMEKLYQQGPKAFWIFFVQYLVRDSLIYIVLPIYIAKFTV